MTFKRRYSPGFNSRKPKQQPEIDPEVHAKAREAVRVFRTMQPGLTGLASALAGRDLPVVLDTAADGERASRTDGHRIFYTPPIQLGERVPHERRLCDRRGGNGRMLCKACAIREKVQADIYHEVAHNAFGTFRKPSSQEVKDAVGVAVRERGTKYLKEIEKQVEELSTRNRLSLMPLAGMISPYLPSMFNALEDARVDEGMYRVRIGTRIIMRSDYIEIFENGTQTLTKGKVMWRDAPLQAQLTIGLFCIGSGLPYRDYLCDKAVEVLEDAEIHDAVANISDAQSSAETFATSLKVLARFRELGYFKSNKDPEDEEPQPDPEAAPESEQDEPQQQDESEDQNNEADSEDSDDPGSEGDPETDQASPEDEGDDDDGDGPESPDESGSGDGDGSSGEDEDQDSSEEDRESGTSGSPGGSGFGPSGVGDGPEEDQAGDPGSGAGSEDVGEGTPEDGMGEGPSDDSGEHDSTEGTPDSPAGDSVPEDSEASPSPGSGGPEDSSTDLGQTEEEGELTDGEGEGASGEPGADPSAGGPDQGGPDGGQGHPDDREGVDESHVQHDDSGSDHEVGGPGDDGADDPDGYDHDDQSRTDSQEERRDGSEAEAVQSEGEPAPDGERGSPGEGEEEGEGGDAEAGESSAGDFDGEDPGLRDEPVPDLGTEEDVELALSQFTEHLDDLNEEGEEERGPRHGNPDMTGDEIKAIQVAVLQEKFFDSPSVGVTGVAESRYNDFSQIPSRHNAWGSAGNSNYHADYDVPEQILGKGLMELRRALSDNYRASFEKHLKSGKINQRTLGRRAWNQDPRLFQKKRLPGKRSYSVIIGIDISGSTAGRNIYLAKRAAFAQAQLCHRLGIEFSIYAHSARSDRFGGQGGFTMDIYEVKSAEEVWGSQQQHALRSLQDCYNNLDGHTIEYYRKKIERRPATDKIILYYTDGAMPASNREEETEILLREIATCKKKKITLLGVGIRTDSPLQYGLDTVKVDNDEDLIEVVRHLERALLHAR